MVQFVQLQDWSHQSENVKLGREDVRLGIRDLRPRGAEDSRLLGVDVIIGGVCIVKLGP